jgi:hypothetical protein
MYSFQPRPGVRDLCDSAGLRLSSSSTDSSIALPYGIMFTTGDIATLAKQQQFSAKGLNGLLASWVFSGISGLGGAKGPGAFWELAGPARVISASDLKQPGARHSTKLNLPVIGKWRITQGADSSYDLPNKSHRGYASFCLDMVRDEGTTEGEPVLAAADGTVRYDPRHVLRHIAYYSWVCEVQHQRLRLYQQRGGSEARAGRVHPVPPFHARLRAIMDKRKARKR